MAAPVALVLLVVIFLYNGETQSGSETFTSAEECAEAGSALTEAANADQGVRFAGFKCILVEGGDKS